MSFTIDPNSPLRKALGAWVLAEGEDEAREALAGVESEIARLLQQKATQVELRAISVIARLLRVHEDRGTTLSYRIAAQMLKATRTEGDEADDAECVEAVDIERLRAALRAEQVKSDAARNACRAVLGAVEGTDLPVDGRRLAHALLDLLNAPWPHF